MREAIQGQFGTLVLRVPGSGAAGGRDTVVGVDKVFGKHSVRAVLLTRPESITRLLLAGKESYHRDLIALAREAGVATEFLSWPEFRRVGGVTDEVICR